MTEMESRIRRDLAALLGEPGFLRIDEELREPNLFAILSTDQMSATINAFLAWLMNPNASHGLEDSFLRAFLVEAINSPPPDRGSDLEGVSPIPYEAVEEAALDWDLMDVRCADLRETSVSTDFSLASSESKVDICLWNDSYEFAIYVENRLSPRDGWRSGPTPDGMPWEHRTQSYVLDLYHQWAREEAGEYAIFQVFMSLDEPAPEETRFVHTIGYAWMADVLTRLARRPTVSEHARMLIRDFCGWLRREIPYQLDPDGLHRELDQLSGAHGLVISRLFDHVSECTGCDEKDELAAFHDIYRRHKPTIDILWRFLLTRHDARVAIISNEVEGLLTPEDGVMLLVMPNRLLATSPHWTTGVEGSEGQPAVEVYASPLGAVCGILAHSRWLGSRADELWHKAGQLADVWEISIDAKHHAKLDFHITRSFYSEFDPARVAIDFVRYCRLLNELFS